MSFVMEDKELSMFERKIDSKCIFACCIENEYKEFNDPLRQFVNEILPEL